MVARGGGASHVTGQMVTRHHKPLVAGNLWARGSLSIRDYIVSVAQRWYLRANITTNKYLYDEHIRYDSNLISILVNLLDELGQIMARYDFLESARVIFSHVRTDFT